MNTSRIVAIAHALPETVLSYEEVERRFGAKEVASIAKMSGIKNRRVVAEGQCASDLAYAAARRLLDHTRVDPKSIDLVAYATQTPDYHMPATAAVFHGRLGLGERCCAFDIVQACSSFMHSLAVSHGLLVSGVARRALVVNADAVTSFLHPLDRGLVSLHGDGAAVALMEPSEPDRGGIEFVEFGTDGSKYDRLIIPAGAHRRPSSTATREEQTDDSGSIRTAENLFMDGPAVFHFCVYKVTAFLKKVLSDRGQSIDDYDLVLLHQANKTMMDIVYKAIGAPPAKRFYYLEENGNSGGASLPSALAEAWRAGVVKPGSRTLLCGFGAGLSWGAASIRWGDDASAAVPGSVDVPATVSAVREVA
jgi:3-oxoacyl-[acyl-carrier-protein] synthase-3